MQLTLLETKKCRCCGVEKELSEFQRRPGAKDGRRNECRECNVASMKERYRLNAEAIKAKRAIYYEENREREIAARAAFRAANAERLSEQRRARYQANLEHNRALGRARYARDPTPHLEQCRRRKFRRRQVKVEDLLERDQGYCGICGRLVDLDDFHIDHIVPRAAGGSNDLENLQLAHPFCNQSKNKTVY